MTDAKSETSNRGEMGDLTKVVSDWVHEYFKNTEIEIGEGGSRGTYAFTAGASGEFSYRGYVEVYEDEHAIRIYLYSPLSVSHKKRLEVADLLARVNFGLKHGKVTLNMDEGVLRFEGEINLNGGVLSVAMINDMVDGGMGILDHYLPAVVAVVHANASSVDAIASLGKEVENRPKPVEATTANAWGWDRFSGAEPLKEWSDDLGNAIFEEAGVDQWALAGRAAIVITDDESYCRELLRRVAADAGMKYVTISSDDVMGMPDPAAFRTLAPVLIFLEPGRWMLAKAESEESREEAERVDAYQRYLMQSLKAFKPNKPVVFATMAHQLDDVAAKLRQVGLFERFFAIPRRSLEHVAEDFIRELGEVMCDDSMRNELGKVGQLLSWNFAEAESRDLAKLYLRRIHARTGQRVSFLDLVHIATHSLTEEAQPQSKLEEERRQVAYHEAGHAVIAILESDGDDIPDYTSIVPGASGFGGITVESYGYFFSKEDQITSYEDFRRDIRVCLGGRAAEEVVYGPEKIGSGASEDLKSATTRSYDAFSKWGFAPSMQTPGKSGMNLAVVVGKPFESEYVRVHKLVSEFLEEEYSVVKNVLIENRVLLDKVADRLMWDPIIDQAEMKEMFESCKRS